MANRFWVGGTANWDATVGSKWATTSGGGGGASIPTATDDVFLDANSGTSGTVTVSTGRPCKSLDCTGFTGTLAGSSVLTISGGLTVGSGMTWNQSGVNVFNATSGTWNLTSNGKTVACTFTFSGAGGTWQFLDSWTSTSSGSLTVSNGTLNLNGFNWTDTNATAQFRATTGTVNLGSGTVTTSQFLFTAGTSTVIPGTCTLKLVGTGNPTFGGHTFYNLWIASGVTNTFNGATNNTFNDIKISVGSGLTFIAGQTQTVTTFTAAGSAGNLIPISGGASASTLAKAGGGTVTVDYCSISNITASPSSTWSATNSTNGGGNTDWTFVSGVNSNFFALF